MLRKIIVTMIAIVALSSCKKETIHNAYIGDLTYITNNENPGAYTKTGPVLAFDETIHQIAISSEDNSFRIQNDDQTQYLSCTLNTSARTLSVGDEVTVMVLTTGIPTLQSKTFYMTLVKSENGKYWFSDAAGELGIVLPQ